MSDFYDMLHAQAAARRAEEENARLRVEIDFRSERMHAAEQERDRLRAELLTAAEKHKALGDAHAKEWEAAAKAEAEANKLRAELADLKACDGPIEQGKAYEAHLQTELDAAHAELAALKAAPSDAEIEAWRRGAARYLGKAWKHINGGEPVNRPEGIPSEGRRMMDEAVALMRRAKQAAPAPRDGRCLALPGECVATASAVSGTSCPRGCFVSAKPAQGDDGLQEILDATREEMKDAASGRLLAIWYVVEALARKAGAS